MQFVERFFLAVLAAAAACSSALSAEATPSSELVMVVMDPLAKPLSCPCVAGYAQRDYEKLAAALKSSLGREVKIVFNESLVAAQKQIESGKVDLVIGKQSVILHDAKTAGLEMKKVAMLTGKDGLTTQRGLVVVPTDDPAKSLSQLKDYRIYFGPIECDEKHAAALRLLKANGVESPAKLETAVACDEGATKILDLAAQGVHGCAVISSYAKPLLEGCGQVPKGALRVVGETADVPFIAAFVNAALPSQTQAQLRDKLIKATATDVPLRIALETKKGFVADDDSSADAAKKK